MLRSLTGLCLLSVVGCGASESARSSMLRETLASPEVQRARVHAPDLVLQAERAHAAAHAFERAENPEAAADEETRARLLLAAATAEADRAEADEERLRLEHETNELDAQSARNEQERLQIEQESARLAAARTAREELARALAQAEHDEPRRRNLVSASRESTSGESAALVRRARLDLAVAIALGAPQDSVDAASAAIERFEHVQPTGPSRVNAASEARVLAERALGQARATTPAATREVIASFERSAREYNLPITSTPRGMIVAPATMDARVMSRLCDLANAFANGPILIETRSQSAAASTRRSIDALVATLVQHGVPRTRVTVSSPTDGASAGSADRATIVLVFAGYVPQASE
ncbi:MAG: hypothetical protein IPK60_13320 [Sandaracinaceae bacterium]|nr:hypothetical protein [Sandaracinaceae bacterium]